MSDIFGVTPQSPFPHQMIPADQQFDFHSSQILLSEIPESARLSRFPLASESFSEVTAKKIHIIQAISMFFSVFFAIPLLKTKKQHVIQEYNRLRYNKRKALTVSTYTKDSPTNLLKIISIKGVQE